jgi:hypothetical protein
MVGGMHGANHQEGALEVQFEEGVQWRLGLAIAVDSYGLPFQQTNFYCFFFTLVPIWKATGIIDGYQTRCWHHVN